MTTEHSTCVVCAWRKDCLKKFQKSKDVTMRCPDFSRDVSIKDTEKTDAEK
jgi:hypothetical protein